MKIDLTIKSIRRGYAKRVKNLYKIVIPQWAFNRGEDYWVYYICHECAHVTAHRVFGHMRHDENYKTIEDMYLADFGLCVKRKKCYPKAILKLSSQEIKCYFN